jgi:Abnormal spindle-like microcephaly-assoc'd, ASPM-SPD-2-Hydin
MHRIEGGKRLLLSDDELATRNSSFSGSLMGTSSVLAAMLFALLLSGCGGGGSTTTTTVTRIALSSVPTSVPFGDVRVGATSTQTAVIKNDGTSTVTVSSITVSGTGFTIQTPTIPFSLGPGQTQSISATFAPVVAGSETGNVVVTGTLPPQNFTSNTPSTVNIALTGNGVTVSLVATPSSLDFGNVSVGSSSTKQVQLSLNMSQAADPSSISSTVSSGTVTGGGFSVTGSPFPVTLSGSQTASFTVQFAPPGVGSSSGTVSLASDAMNSPTLVSLSGKGVTTVHSVSLAWDQPAPVTGVTVTGYNVYRQDATSGCSGSVAGKTLVGSTTGATSTAFTDNTVLGGQTYCYVATSVASGGESSASNEVQATIPSP